MNILFYTKTIVLVFSLYFFPQLFQFGNAQIKQDHLLPVSGPFDMGDAAEYYMQIINVLHEGLGEWPKIRFEVVPGYSQPEGVLQIEHEFGSNIYYMVYHEANPSIAFSEWWKDGYAERSKKSVKKYKIPIRDKSVNKIYNLFRTVVLQAKFTDDEYCDAEEFSYYFSYWAPGLRSGEICSPLEGTLMKKLVDIGKELIVLTKKGNSYPLDNSLYNRINSLILELNTR